MAIKFLSGLNLSNVTAGSLLKLDSNGNIVAAVDGTDYNTGSADSWSTTGSDIYRNSDVRIGTYQSGVAPSARLHVFDYQTTDPKLLIEDGNTGDASMQFKVSTQQYTMGIDNSDSDKFIIANAGGFNLAANTHALEISTAGKVTIPAHTSNGTVRFEVGGFNRLRLNSGIDLLGYTQDHLWVIGNSGTNTINLGGDWDWDKQVAISYQPNTVGNAGGIMILGQTEKNNANWTHGITKLYTNGTERLRIDSSGNVKVYGGDLDLRDPNEEDATNVLYFNANNGASTNDSNDIGTGIVWKPDYTGYSKRSAGIMQIGEGNYFKSGLAFYTNNTSNNSTDWSERMRLDMDGNLGIGTSEPSYKLHVEGNVGITEYLQHKGDNNTYLRFSTDLIRLAAGGVEMIRLLEDATQDAVIINEGGADVDFRVESDTDTHAFFIQGSDGYAGFGTSTPNTQLHVDGTITVTGASLLRRYVSGWSNATTHDVIYNGWTETLGDYVYLKAQGNSTSGHGMMLVGDNVAYIGRSDVETGAVTGLDQTWATFKNGGVGIGTTNPAGKLHLEGDFESGKALVIKGTYGTDTEYYFRTHGTNSELLSLYAAGVRVMNWRSNRVDTYQGLNILGGEITTGTSNHLVIGSSVQIGQGDEDPVIEFKYGTTSLGKIDQFGDIHAGGFKVSGTTGFLKSDGSVDTSTYVASSALSSYLPLTGGTMTGDLVIDSGGGDTSTSQAYTAFDTLTFNNLHSSSALGPNKIIMYDNGGAWKGGFGIHSGTVAYYSGDTHKWYKTGSGPGGYTFTERMTLDGSGNLSVDGSLTAGGGLSASSGTFTGDLRVTNGDNNGIRFHSGGANITSVSSGDIVIQRLSQLRLGDATNWDWNKWAGIMYNSTSEVLYIGGPSASQFTSNSNPPSIDVDFVGVDTVNTPDLNVTGLVDTSSRIATGGQITVNNRTAISVGQWSASGNSTGAIRITLPGSHSSNWSMIVLRITAYEYNSTAHTIYYVSGHDWTSGWYNNGVTKIGNSSKDIKLGYDSNKDYVILGGVSDTWSYGHVTVDVMAHPSFYSSNMDITSGWDVRQTTDISGITTQAVTNKRVLTTSDEGSGNGIDADTVDGLQASSFLRSDTTDTATGALTLSNTGNHYNGHHYFDAYDANGNHYPHYQSGSNANGAVVHTRVYTNATNYKVFKIDGKNDAVSWDGDKLATETWSNSQFVNVSGDSMTGDLTSTGVITSDVLRLTNDATDTFRHRVAVYDNGGTSYGMMLWNANGTSGDWGTMIYGPNQSNRRISFGKVNTDTPTNHSHVSEIAHFDLDDSSLNLTGDLKVNGGDVTITKQNDAPTLTLLHDGTNPSTNDLLFKMQFQSDYDGSHQNWGKIEVDTNASSVRTNMDFYVKSTSGSEQLGFRIEGQASATPKAYFYNDVTTTASVLANNLYTANNIYHTGDTDTSIGFSTDTINFNTGGGVRATISDSGAKFNNNTIVAGGSTLSLGERAEGDDNGRTVMIEGTANGSNGEGSGRIFFTEHNSTDASADKYGLSLYYEGDPNAQLPSGFQPNTGNATWSLRRHNNSVNGVAIMRGSRSDSNVVFEGNLFVPNVIYHAGDTNTYMQFHAGDQWRVVTGGSERLEVNNTYTTVANDFWAEDKSHAGNQNWKTKTYIRAVGVEGGSIADKWVHLTTVDIDAAYDKAALKFKIHGYDDVSCGTENIDVLYENGGSVQETHRLDWYSTDGTANLFKAVKSTHSGSNLAHSYELWVQMAGDWRDTFTVEVETWTDEAGFITYSEAVGQATAPTGDTNDQSKTSREWYTKNTTIYADGTALQTQSQADSRYLQLTGGTVSGAVTLGAQFTLSSFGTGLLRVDAGSVSVDTSGYLTSMPANSTVTSITFGGVKVEEALDRPGLLEINRDGTDTWSGIMTKFSGTAEWALMGNETSFGLYDDQQNEWAWRYVENSYFEAYNDGSVKLQTASNGVKILNVLELGNLGDTNGGVLKLNGTTANKQAVIKCTNGNLHIDSEDGNALYLNYYEGTSDNIIFGNGNGGASGAKVTSSGVVHATSVEVAGNLSVRNITARDIVSAADRTYALGTDANRWAVVFCETLDSAGQHESNLQDEEQPISQYETGTVLSWKDGKNRPCTQYADHMRMGIAVHGQDSPLIQGAEPVLCTGVVEEGDYLVTSDKEGHAVAVPRNIVKEQMLFDCVIGKALENGDGESHLVKTWINI